MLDPEERKDWIYELAPFDEWNERLFACIFAVFGRPQNYLDVGHGTGAMVNFALSMGINAVGVDQIGPLHDERHLLKRDLREPLRIPDAFDLVSCLEVAEHIEPDYEVMLVDNIARHMNTGAVLIWSAAGPGQDGHNHFNTRLGSHWRDLFHEQDVSFRHDYTQQLQMMILASLHPLADHLVGNLQVFDK